jgi:hypothetical protein
LLLLSGGKTEDEKYCEKLAEEVARLKPTDHKMKTQTLTIDMNTGRKSSM